MSLDHRELEQLDDLRAGIDTAAQEGVMFTDAQDSIMWAGGSFVTYVRSPGELYNPFEQYYRHLDPNNIEYYTTPHNDTRYHAGDVIFTDLNHPYRVVPDPIPFTNRPIPSPDRVIYSRPAQGKLSMMQRLKGLFENVTIRWSRRK